MHRFKLYLSLISLLPLFLLSSIPTFAQPSSTPDVLPLILETSQRTSQNSQKTPVSEVYQYYWWGGESAPLWTSTDNAIFSLSPRFIKPNNISQISSVFKLPQVTLSNAIALGKTFGASYIILGDYNKIEHAEKPLYDPLITLQFDGQLVDIRGSKPEVLRKFAIQRTFLRDQDSREVFFRKDILSVVVDSISKVDPSQSEEVSFPALKSDKDELTLILRNLETLSELYELIPILEKRTDVQSVELRWAAENRVALIIHPVKLAGPLDKTVIKNFMLNHRFSSFAFQDETDANDEVIVVNRVELE